ncbi:hypothetical protein B0H14DRAFT_2633011 [Mycena olivaceomarginata]|nr:hypothetical protein B0H14DRAFT_2633011 [Mycena olivaceomarginata]
MLPATPVVSRRGPGPTVTVSPTRLQNMGTTQGGQGGHENFSHWVDWLEDESLIKAGYIWNQALSQYEHPMDTPVQRFLSLDARRTSGMSPPNSTKREISTACVQQGLKTRSKARCRSALRSPQRSSMTVHNTSAAAPMPGGFRRPRQVSTSTTRLGDFSGSENDCLMRLTNRRYKCDRCQIGQPAKTSTWINFLKREKVQDIGRSGAAGQNMANSQNGAGFDGSRTRSQYFLLPHLIGFS